MPSLMIADHGLSDLQVRAQIKSLKVKPSYWDFRGSKRDAMHGVTQYPAMMVPAMQGELLDLCHKPGQKIRVIDPFVGAGTTLVEAMRRGFDFWGQDINPLAVLISLTKTGPFHVPELEEATERVYLKAQLDQKASLEITFPGLEKWFSPTVAQELSRIRRAIQAETDQWVRRMLWISLAETVRLTSNSRTTTFKLHIRSEQDLASRNVETFEAFSRLATQAVQRVRAESALLAEKGFLHGNAFSGKTCIQFGRSELKLPGQSPFDLLVSSPPYGDGVSTVPYGQYSFLPLQWIDHADIPGEVNASFFNSAYKIDGQTLGGSRCNALKRAEPAMSESSSLRGYLKELVAMPRDRRVRVAAFFADLLPVLNRVCERMRPGAYMIWTVGNRRVGGRQQPLDKILTELLEHRGCVLIKKIPRTIPSKRMATRNGISQTMRKEQVLIMQTRS